MASAVLTEGTRGEAGSIYAGVLAKKIKSISPELFEGEVLRILEIRLKNTIK